MQELNAFNIEIQDKYTAIRILADKFTAKVAPELKAELVLLNGKGTKNIIIDMDSTSYCDSSGLSAVLVANRLCKENGGAMVVCSIQPAVNKLIEISQLTNVLNITPSFNEAVDFIFMDELERGLNDSEGKLN